MFNVEVVDRALTYRRVRAAALDMDDTLTPTSDFFRAHEDRYYDFVISRLPEIRKPQLKAIFVQASMAAFATPFSVTPARWDYVTDQVAGHFPHSPRRAFKDGLPLIMAVYSSSPPPYPGAIETVKAIRDTGRPVVIVTHGNGPWSELKFAHLRLADLGCLLHIVNENGFKTAADWQSGIHKTGFSPSEHLGAGDNKIADVLALASLGLDHCNLFHIWPQHAIAYQGQLPPTIPSLKAVSRLPRYLELTTPLAPSPAK